MIEDLIYDVGMHNGDDTAHYLARGFRVVAIEAHPGWVARGRDRFADAIAAGRLAVVHAAVTPTTGPLTFWISEGNDVWSSIDPAVAGKDGTPPRPVVVDGVRFRDILSEHGIPHYLKIDIEGGEVECLRALCADDRPRYVSVEASSLDYLCQLRALGYNAFKAIDQSDHNRPPRARNNAAMRARIGRALAWSERHGYHLIRHHPVTRALAPLWRRVRFGEGAAPPPEGSPGRFPRGSSGPFGEETVGEWLSVENVAYNWLHTHLGHRSRGTLNPDSWFDFHATTH